MAVEKFCYYNPQAKVEEALERYLKLLNHYGVSQSVQDAALNAMLELPPEETIRRVQIYWEDTFPNQSGNNGHNGNGNDKSSHDRHCDNMNGLSLHEKILYKKRRVQQRISLNSQKDGRPKVTMRLIK